MKRHHPWCNEQNALRPELGAKGCHMCEGLTKDHPVYPSDTPDTLMKRHFPNNRRIVEDEQ